MKDWPHLGEQGARLGDLLDAGQRSEGGGHRGGRVCRAHHLLRRRLEEGQQLGVHHVQAADHLARINGEWRQCQGVEGTIFGKLELEQRVCQKDSSLQTSMSRRPTTWDQKNA